MPRVVAEAELRTLTECLYSYPLETLSDLQKVRSLFSDLRLHVDFYCFPNKEKKRLVYLAGTVPIHYEGSEYNIPVCIWIHETHPVSRPRCYICPSVSMVINPSCPCVDASGNISLDGLSNWTRGVSNLSLLVSEMRLAFQRDTPLYAQCPAQTTPPSVQVLQSAGRAPPPTGVQLSQSAGRAPPPTSVQVSQSAGRAPSPAGIHVPQSAGQALPPTGIHVSHSTGRVPSSAGVWVSPSAGQAPPTAAESTHHYNRTSSASSSITSSITSSSPQSCHLSPISSHLSGQKASQWEQSREVRVRKSYTEELQGIDFSAPPTSTYISNNNPFLNMSSSGIPPAGVPSADPLTMMMGTLKLNVESNRDKLHDSPLRNIRSEAHIHPTDSRAAPGRCQDLLPSRLKSKPTVAADLIQMAARLPPEQERVFLSLMAMEGPSFSPADVMEAVQLNRDFPSALKFLTHNCPICQEQVSFSKRPLRSGALSSWCVLSVTGRRSKVMGG